MTCATSNPNPLAQQKVGWGKLILPLLAAFCLASLYAVASWHNQFVYDDHEVIENQFPIHGLSDVIQIFREPHYLNFPYYRPITRTTFALQKTLSDDNPRPFHLFNAALAGALLLATYLLLRRPAFQLGESAALIVSIWFCVHPAMSECIYPAASGRETLLPCLIIITTCWAYLHPGRKWFCISMGLFILSLLCKEQAVVLPGIFLLADALGISHRQFKSFGKYLIHFIPIAIIFFAYFLLRHLIFGENTLKLTLFDHPLEPFKSLLYSIQTAVLPFMDLHYEPGFANWFDPRLGVFSSIAILALIASALLIVKCSRLALFWLGWIILLQLPTAQIVQQDAQYSERYVAMAILGFPALAAVVISQIFSKRETRLMAWIITIIWAILLGTISFLRGSFYQDETTFTLQWQTTSPQAAGPYNGFGLIAQQQHDPRTAIQSYEKALAIDPGNATAHNNLANLLSDENDFNGASTHYEWLLHHNAIGADSAATLSNYAQLLGTEAYRTGNNSMRDRAHELLEDAIKLRPGYAQAHYVLGLWNEAFATKEQAIVEYKIALRLRPDLVDAKHRLANLDNQSSVYR